MSITEAGQRAQAEQGDDGLYYVNYYTKDKQGNTRSETIADRLTDYEAFQLVGIINDLGNRFHI